MVIKQGLEAWYFDRLKVKQFTEIKQDLEGRHFCLVLEKSLSIFGHYDSLTNLGMSCISFLRDAIGKYHRLRLTQQ